MSAEEDPKIFSDSDEVSEEEEIVKKRKKRRTGVAAFIEDEAAVDDEDDSEEELAEAGYEEEEFDEVNVKRDRHRQLDLNRKKQLEEEDAEVIAQRLKERHGKTEITEFRGDYDHVPQNLLIPSVSDPKIWLVRCKPGSERGLVGIICKKFFGLQNTERPLKILSCFTRDNLKGFLYLEAERITHVQEAIEKLSNVYASKLTLIPVKEMVDCLKVKAKEIELKKDCWVRVKRGKYAGDLARVIEVAESGENAVIKLIPRIEYTKTSDKRKKSDIRVPQKLFSVSDFSKKDVQMMVGGCMYQGEFFDSEGYLEKSVKVTSLETSKVNPSLEEITRFSGGAISDRTEELSQLATLNLASQEFANSEKVIVLTGEMKGVTGVVYSIERNIVTITPDPTFGLKNKVEFPAEHLAKRFVKGDHVRVVNGIHKGETGTVLKSVDNVITVLSDTSYKTMQVFSKDIRSASAVSAMPQSNHQYQKFDFVQQSPTQVGVIVGIDNDTFVLLDPYGNTTKVKAKEIRGKRDTSKAVTSDINGEPITVKEAVMVIEDNSTNRRQAVVLHVYRSFVYLQSKDVAENDGVFVAKNSNIALINKKTSANAFARPFARPYNRRKDELNAKTVTITSGPMKGYLGIVKDTTETTARVELHTNNRIITIDKSKLNIMDGSTARPNYSSNNSNAYSYEDQPLLSSRTPGYNMGAKTPAYDVGGATPAWDAGSRTPGPSWDRGDTSAWEPSSRTPAAGPRSTRNIVETPNYANTPAAYDSVETSTPYNPQTPAYASMNTGSAYPTMGSIAATPVVATPFSAATPAPDNDYYSAPVAARDTWLTINILVVIQPGFSDRKYDNQTATCTDVEKHMAILQLPTGETIRIPDSHLKAVIPEKKDRFKIISGENRGKSGNLLSIDGHEGVVKIDENDEILMMNLDSLAKIAE